MTAITMSKTLSDRNVFRYVHARYPEKEWKLDGWIIAGTRWLSYRDAMDEALAEKESYEDGISKKPAWLA
jgi:polyphosphate kinase 2 (PPK2 family)